MVLCICTCSVLLEDEKYWKKVLDLIVSTSEDQITFKDLDWSFKCVQSAEKNPLFLKWLLQILFFRVPRVKKNAIALPHPIYFFQESHEYTVYTANCLQYPLILTFIHPGQVPWWTF